jgi:hypothetical protein
MKNRGIMQKSEYGGTWMRYVDLMAESGGIADYSTMGTTPAGNREQILIPGRNERETVDERR